jgi:hypothetical protein
MLVSFSRQPEEDDDHSNIVMPTPRRQSRRPTTPFTDGRHNAEVGIIVHAHRATPEFDDRGTPANGTLPVFKP